MKGKRWEVKTDTDRTDVKKGHREIHNNNNNK